MSTTWVGIVGVPAALVGLLLGLRALKQRGVVHPELLRKLMHVGMGLVTLTFPWVFPSPAPVVALAAGAVALLVALKRVPALRARFGGVIDGVARESAGDVYFPVAVAAVFVLADGDPILFTIPVLTLTVADAVAALVGVSYGRTHYQTLEGRKSAEGSIAFFTLAFLSTHIPLLLFTDTGRAETLLIGLTFGVLAMLLEAVAWRGLDNLFVPLGGFLLLKAYLRMDVRALLLVLVATVLILVLLLALRRRRTLSDSAVAAGVLVGYVSWTVGGWTWLVPPLMLFLSYTVLWPRADQVRERPHDLVAVLAVAASGLVWLLLAYATSRPALYYPYTIAFAANLCFIGITWFRTVEAGLPQLMAVAVSALVGWIVLFVPYLVIEGVAARSLAAALAALAWTAVAGLAFARFIPYHGPAPTVAYPWLRQTMIGIVSSALGLLLAF